MIEIGEVIFELIKLLRINKIQIQYPWKNNSKYQKYFSLVRDSEKMDDEIIAKKLGYTGRKDRSFIRLQQRFENKLSYLLFSIDLVEEKGTDYAKSVQTVVLCYSQGKLLMQRRLTHVGMYYIKKAANLSKNIFYSEYDYLLNLELYKYYSSINLDLKKSKFYLTALNKSKLVLDAELKIKQYESELLDAISKNLDINKLKKKASNFCSETLDILGKHFSYALVMNSFQIVIFKYNLFYEFDKIYSFCIEIKDLLTKNKLSVVNAEFLIDKVLINSYISNHEFIKAYEYIEKTDFNLKPGTHNYFSRMNQYFQVLIRCNKYDQLLMLTLEVFKYKTLQVYTRFYELWLIKRGYLHLFVELGGIDNPLEEFQSITKYKLNKLLNQISIYSKDKSGQNAALRILEMCFYIVRKEEDKLIDRVESVQQYAYKYLRKDENLRFRIFIRMLIQCYKRNYNIKAIKRHTNDLKLKLIQNPQLFIDSVAESEIIPLELLWEKLLEFIENNYRQ